MLEASVFVVVSLSEVEVLSVEVLSLADVVLVLVKLLVAVFTAVEL